MMIKSATAWFAETRPGQKNEANNVFCTDATDSVQMFVDFTLVYKDAIQMCQYWLKTLK
jgi:hypothetical protein